MPTNFFISEHVSLVVVTFVAGPPKGNEGINESNSFLILEADKDSSIPVPAQDEAKRSNLESIRVEEGVRDTLIVLVLTAVKALDEKKLNKKSCNT